MWRDRVVDLHCYGGLFDITRVAGLPRGISRVGYEVSSWLGCRGLAPSQLWYCPKSPWILLTAYLEQRPGARSPGTFCLHKMMLW